MSVALLWFRRDLRLQDNPALQAALQGRFAVLSAAPWQMTVRIAEARLAQATAQAQAEADTTMKVSEVMQRSSTRVEVYFWTKDNKDFEPQEMKDAFAQRCPDPR